MPPIADGTVGPRKRKQGPVVAAPRFTDTVTVLPPSTIDTSGRGLMVGLAALPGITPDGIFDDKRLSATGGVFWFQCPPLETMPVDYSWNWNDYVTVASGMHSNPQARSLTTITFSSLLVDTAEERRVGGAQAQLPELDQPTAKVPGIPGPGFAVADPGGGVLWAVAWLRRLGDSMRPFQLQWGQPALWGKWDGMMAATLRSFHSEERAGELDARYFTVAFTEYPDAKLLRYAPPPPPPGASNKHRGPHTSTNGQKMKASLNSVNLPPDRDTLALIAKHYYGSASKWRLIAKASGLTEVSANQNLPTTVGEKHPPARIQVPELPAVPKTRRGTP